MPEPKKLGRPKKTQSPVSDVPTPDVLANLLSEVEELKRKDVENQASIKMLTEVADKGRVFNYENKNTKKQPFKVKLSMYNGGVIVGWRTVKDERVIHPTTGLQVGEVQEYELLVDKEGETTRVTVSGYPAFSNARYDSQIECEIVGKKEDYQGNTTYDVRLPKGRVITLADRFLN